eukprot:14318189-Ditylum_brightwellii.AAC.1
MESTYQYPICKIAKHIHEQTKGGDMRVPMTKAAATTAAFTSHTSFQEILHRYDGFILDQFGVMHNGKDSLPGAVDCVNQLSALGKKLIILSNTSSPSTSALARLPSMGFDVKDFVGAVTSGEEASCYIKETYGCRTNENAPRKKALWFTWKKSLKDPIDFIHLCGDVDITSDVKEADFVIAHGTQIVRGGSEDEEEEGCIQDLGSFMEDGDLTTSIDGILEQCKERDLPMVCANPDFVVLLSDGSTGHMP